MIQLHSIWSGILVASLFVSGCGKTDGPSLIPGSPSSSTTGDLASLASSAGTVTRVSASLYVVSVPNGSSSITLSPTLVGTGASITINSVPVGSGGLSGSIALPVGVTEVPAVLTLPNGSTQNITIRIGRNVPSGLNAYRSLGSLSDAELPWGGVRLHPNGHTLYGMTSSGGTGSQGTLFQLETDGSGFAILHHFAGGAGDGKIPRGDVVFSADGSVVYGMTTLGGSNNRGVLFSMNSDGTGFTILHNFNWLTGRFPEGTLLLDGTTLYGMTAGGNSNGATSFGVVFNIQTDGTGFTLLKDFDLTNTGGRPLGGLLKYQNQLYGMTQTGGNSGAGQGTIFRINLDGTGFQILRTFAGGISDGQSPRGTLIEHNGLLYGFTREGGANNEGTVFTILPDGTGFTLLHSFSETTEGGFPMGSPALAFDETKLYGFTSSGGTGAGGIGTGTLFSLNLDGSNFVVEHAFQGNPSDGDYPFYSVPVVVADSVFGLTEEGGTFDKGFIFALGL